MLLNKISLYTPSHLFYLKYDRSFKYNVTKIKLYFIYGNIILNMKKGLTTNLRQTRMFITTTRMSLTTKGL